MLLAGPDAGPEIRDSLREVRSAGEKAASLTRQLLLFSRKQIATPASSASARWSPTRASYCGA